jgi:hypothetical protein
MVVRPIGRLQIVDRDDERAGRTISEFFSKPLEHRGRSLSGNFDSPVGPIADPPGHAQLARRFTHEPAESHALHATTHKNVNAHSHTPTPTPTRVVTPAVRSQQRNEANGGNVTLFDLTVPSLGDDQFLLLSITDRNQQPASFGELVE